MAGYRINPESNLDKKMKTVKFFNLYFEKLKYLFLTNVFFLIFDLLAAVFAYSVYSTYTMSGTVNFISIFLGVVFLNIGMSGVCSVVRYSYIKKEFSTFKTFIRGIKENWAKFTLHGLFFCFVVFVNVSSFTLYLNGTKSNFLFWVPLVITVPISLLACFMSYYLNLMTVTMNIKMKQIYRNAMLFSFGELKNNIMATFALLVYFAVIFAIAVILNKLYLIVIICSAIFILTGPSTIQFILTFYLYDSMIDILDESKRSDDDTVEIKNKPEIKKEEAEEIARLTSDSKDEYIFYNGKMVKRSAVEEKLGAENDDDF